MMWLVLLGSHSALADDSPTPLAKASALSAPQRRDLPADTTAKDAATKPPRDSARSDATMKRRPEYLQSEALVAEAVSAGRAPSTKMRASGSSCACRGVIKRVITLTPDFNNMFCLKFVSGSAVRTLG